MKIICVIPSRIGSTRLPRKPLQLIRGKPMIQWVYESAQRCQLLTDVVVATDSEEIAAVVHGIKGKVVMTSPHYITGSDRVAAVAEQYKEADIIINLQGDEPFIQPHMLEQLVQPWLNGMSPDMSTLAYHLEPTAYHSPDAVKVILDQAGYALYFSRAPIPYYRTQTDVPVFNHMGLYAFRRDFLLKYTKLPQTPLEKAESLEQLRALEHGYKIFVSVTESRTLEINTPEELARAEQFAADLEKTS